MNTHSLVPQVFNFQQVPLRGLLIEQQPWMDAKDLCGLLGIQNSRDTLKKVLDKDEIAVATIMATDQVAGVDNRYTRTQRRKVQVVNESGMYALVFKSRKPEAKVLRKWITTEVLPAIRKGGTYTAEPGYNPLEFLNGIFGTAGQAAPKVEPKPKPAPKALPTGLPAGVLDARAVPCTTVGFLQGRVRMVPLEGKQWYSLIDVMRCLGSTRVSCYTTARTIQAGHKARVRLYGAMATSWFVDDTGLRLIMGSRGLLTSQLTLNLAH